MAESIPLVWKGKNYVLAPLTHHEEGLFVSAHAAWAQGEIEATREELGEGPYQRALMAFMDMRLSGQFSYGGPLSMCFLNAPEGRARYFGVLMRKGHQGEEKGAAPPPLHVLVRAVRDDDPELAAAYQQLLSRDFFSWLRRINSQARGGGRPDDGSSNTSAPPETT